MYIYTKEVGSLTNCLYGKIIFLQRWMAIFLTLTNSLVWYCSSVCQYESVSIEEVKFSQLFIIIEGWFLFVNIIHLKSILFYLWMLSSLFLYRRQFVCTNQQERWFYNGHGVDYVSSGHAFLCCHSGLYW